MFGDSLRKEEVPRLPILPLQTRPANKTQYAYEKFYRIATRLPKKITTQQSRVLPDA